MRGKARTRRSGYNADPGLSDLSYTTFRLSASSPALTVSERQRGCVEKAGLDFFTNAVRQNFKFLSFFTLSFQVAYIPEADQSNPLAMWRPLRRVATSAQNSCLQYAKYHSGKGKTGQPAKIAAGVAFGAVLGSCSMYMGLFGEAPALLGERSQGSRPRQYATKTTVLQVEIIFSHLMLI